MIPLLEHQAKRLLRDAGFAVPPGVVLTRPEHAGSVPEVVGQPPWMVKAQVLATGRAAMGGIRTADSVGELSDHIASLLGSPLGGVPCSAVLVECKQRVVGEWFVAVVLDPGGDGVLVTCSPDGGSGIESALSGKGLRGLLFTPDDPPDQRTLAHAWNSLVEIPDSVTLAASRLFRFAMSHDALLAEINPLGVGADGSAVVLDAHMTVDDAASFRQGWFSAFADPLADLLPGLAWQREWGGHFVELDSRGVVATVNTGAGAGMFLVDELERRGLRCFNFSDIRTGNITDHPERMSAIVDRILTGESVRAVLVNIHAGITDCLAILPLLIQAGERLRSTADVVVRLAGRGSHQARKQLRARGFSVARSIRHAVELVSEACQEASA